MELNVKTSAGGKSFKLEGIENTLTVLDLKKKCAAECGFDAEQQRLFLKGKLLKDDDTLEACKITDKAALFLVKGAAAPSAGGSASTVAATATAAEKKEPEEILPSVACAGGCGFYGTAKTDNMCSKCYNKREAEKETAEEKDKEKAKDEKDKSDAEKKKDDDVDMKDAGKEEEKQPEQSDKTKCWMCTKKCGLTGFACRCGYVFCAKHRHAEDHECKFDHLGKGREILAKNNPNISVKGGDGILDGT